MLFVGMGGKLEYFGFWIDAEFGKGYCSESCTTYRDYKIMSGSKVSFTICTYKFFNGISCKLQRVQNRYLCINSI